MVTKISKAIVAIFNKIRNIIKGWYYKTFKQKQELANTRLALCKNCEHRKHVDILGDICGECGCVLEAKARVLDEHCILNKW